MHYKLATLFDASFFLSNAIFF